MTKKHAREIRNKVLRAKGLLRNLHNNILDLTTNKDGATHERVLLNAAREAVAASEAELASAVFSIETLEDMAK